MKPEKVMAFICVATLTFLGIVILEGLSEQYVSAAATRLVELKAEGSGL